jgi:hypothetical protein
MSRFKKVLAREISIFGSPSGGYIVAIGCQRFVYETPSAAVQLVLDYLNDPIGLEKEFHESQNPDKGTMGAEEVAIPTSRPAIERR